MPVGKQPPPGIPSGHNPFPILTDIWPWFLTDYTRFIGHFFRYDRGAGRWTGQCIFSSVRLSAFGIIFYSRITIIKRRNGENIMEIRFDRITPGIQKYTKLMQWVLETDVSRDMDFQRFYNGFYRMRQRNSAFYTSYYRSLKRTSIISSWPLKTFSIIFTARPGKFMLLSAAKCWQQSVQKCLYGTNLCCKISICGHLILTKRIVLKRLFSCTITSFSGILRKKPRIILQFSTNITPMPLWRTPRKLIGFSGESKKDRKHLHFWFLERIATPACGLARDLSRINFPCSLWCVVFLCIAQSDFILFVDYSLYHTTNGDVLQHRKKKRWAASVSDYRCCPLKLCFDPLSDTISWLKS